VERSRQPDPIRPVNDDLSRAAAWRLPPGTYRVVGRRLRSPNVRARVLPLFVSAYWTRGGRSANTVRFTRSLRDRSRRMAASVDVLTPWSRVCKSRKRLVLEFARRLTTDTTWRRPMSRARVFAGQRQRGLPQPQADSVSMVISRFLTQRLASIAIIVLSHHQSNPLRPLGFVTVRPKQGEIRYDQGVTGPTSGS